MWGTPNTSLRPARSVRFIPTHVGNSFGNLGWHLVTPVHPHACGELDLADNTADLSKGSSPRMWGTLNEYDEDKTRDRFIPTHVGNSN